MSKSIVVTDGVRKFRLVMEGDLETVTIAKIKRYLSKSTAADPSSQILYFNGVRVLDSATGQDIGLYDGAVLNLEIGHQQKAEGGEGDGKGGSAASASAPSSSSSRPHHQQQQQQPSSSSSSIGLMNRHVSPPSPSTAGAAAAVARARSGSSVNHNSAAATVGPMVANASSAIASTNSATMNAQFSSSFAQQNFQQHAQNNASQHTSRSASHTHHQPQHHLNRSTATIVADVSRTIADQFSSPPPPSHHVAAVVPAPLPLHPAQSNRSRSGGVAMDVTNNTAQQQQRREEQTYFAFQQQQQEGTRAAEAVPSTLPPRIQRNGVSSSSAAISRTTSVNSGRQERQHTQSPNPHQSSSVLPSKETEREVRTAGLDFHKAVAASVNARVGGPGGMLSPRSSHTTTNGEDRSVSARSTSLLQQNQHGDPTYHPRGYPSNNAAADGGLAATQQEQKLYNDAENTAAAAVMPYSRTQSAHHAGRDTLPSASSASALVTTERELLLQSERDDLRRRLDEKESMIAQEREAIDTEYRRLREERNHITEERRAMEEEQLELTRKTRLLKEKEDALAHQEQISNLRSSSQSAQQQLQREHIDARHEEELNTLRSQMKRLQRENEDLHSDILRLKREKEEDFDRLMQEHDDEVDRLRKNGEKNDAEVVRLQRLLEDKHDKLEEAREDLQIERKGAARIAEQLTKAIAEGDELRTEIEQLKEDISLLESQLKSTKTALLKAQKGSETLDDRVQHAEARAEKAEDSLARANEKLTVANKNAKLAIEQIEALKRKEQQLLKEKNAIIASKQRLSGSALIDASLKNFSVVMRVPPLRLDSNLTCVVTIEESGSGAFSLLVTHDPSTEKLFLYATLLNQLPPQDSVKIHLYEELLEGALLGREMGGGGVGISRRNSLVIMSCFVDLKHCDEYALGSLAKPFVAAVRRWIVHCEEVAGVPASQSLMRAPSSAAAGGESYHQEQHQQQAYDESFSPLEGRGRQNPNVSGSFASHNTSSIAAATTANNTAHLSNVTAVHDRFHHDIGGVGTYHQQPQRAAYESNHSVSPAAIPSTGAYPVPIAHPLHGQPQQQQQRGGGMITPQHYAMSASPLRPTREGSYTETF